MSLDEGRLIRKIRKTLNITQLDLAQKIGLSHQPINQFENGFESINAISILFKTERYGAIFAEKYCTFANT